MNTLNKRWKSETPDFWKKVQKIAMTVAAVGTIIATAPISLPAVLVSVSGYLIVTGSVVSAVSQLTVKDSSETNNTDI